MFIDNDPYARLPGETDQQYADRLQAIVNQQNATLAQQQQALHNQSQTQENHDHGQDHGQDHGNHGQDHGNHGQDHGQDHGHQRQQQAGTPTAYNTTPVPDTFLTEYTKLHPKPTDEAALADWQKTYDAAKAMHDKATAPAGVTKSAETVADQPVRLLTASLEIPVGMVQKPEPTQNQLSVMLAQLALNGQQAGEVKTQTHLDQFKQVTGLLKTA